MQAVQTSKSSHNRFRSSSDPFVDPSFSSPSSRTSAVKASKRPPAPPPKSNMPSAQRDSTDAVRETVTVDSNPRSKMSRSQTALQPASNGSVRLATPTSQRSQSQDSVLAAAAALEKAKAGGKRPKKGSQHADVIDRMDFTGVGPMFHHDGPFDACAPSRNRHRTKAPMLAWSSRPATENALSQPPDARAEEPYEPYYEPPKKKIDAIAEAWGIHEPEPFEEFFAGGGNHGDTPTNSIYAGKEGHNSRNKRRDSRDDYDRSANRRSVLPPPQPIFAPDSQAAMDIPTGSPPSGTRPDGPKRTKSLMHRIRKMRDSPNVPVGDDNMTPPSPTNMEHSTSGQSGASRPTHRSQPSFLGRFAGGRGGSAQKDNTYPPPENSEPFVFIEDSRGQSQNKELPQPPPMNASGSGDRSYEGEAVSPGLGRKSSLLRRVRGVVKGTTK